MAMKFGSGQKKYAGFVSLSNTNDRAVLSFVSDEEIEVYWQAFGGGTRYNSAGDAAKNGLDFRDKHSLYAVWFHFTDEDGNDTMVPRVLDVRGTMIPALRTAEVEPGEVFILERRGMARKTSWSVQKVENDTAPTDLDAWKEENEAAVNGEGDEVPF